MALSLAQAAHAQNPLPGGQKLRTMSFGPFLIAEAYPASSHSYANDAKVGQIRDNHRWCATAQGEDNTTAAPGALALCTRNAGGSDIRQRIDINAFATCPSGFNQPFVQSYRLIKDIFDSRKCPGTYQRQTFIQFGTNIRTWWTLIYTAPGTTFTLELTTRCVRETFPFDVELHVDRYVWRVVVTFDSLDKVIDVLHSNSLSTSEIPCIAAENMYIALKRSVVLIKNALNGTSPSSNDPLVRRLNAQNEVFNMEALVIAFCAFGDCFESSTLNPGGVFFPTFPPTNDTQMSFGGMLTGVLDTPENPCCCKLLVDIERLAEAYEIVSL
jgi:hypothetical protein